MKRLTSNYYSTSGTWTCPAGVTQITVIAHGGGAGGCGGRNTDFEGPINTSATTPYLVTLTVIPNTTYTITIGAGGTGGASRTSNVANGGVGGNTLFGGLKTFKGGHNNIGSPTTAEVDVGHTSGLNVGYSVSSGFANSVSTMGTSAGFYIAGQSGVSGFTDSVGGTAGNANSSGVGTAGGNASGFGASGGSGGAGSSGGGVGGNGGPGQMWIIWVE